MTVEERAERAARRAIDRVFADLGGFGGEVSREWNALEPGDREHLRKGWVHEILRQFQIELEIDLGANSLLERWVEGES
jgi:hypothetical protein